MSETENNNSLKVKEERGNEDSKPKRKRKGKVKTTLWLDEDVILLLNASLANGRQYKSYVANSAIRAYCSGILSDTVVERFEKENRTR